MPMKKYLLLFLVIININSFSQQGLKNVDALSFKILINQNKAVLIDLRTTDEILKKGKIKGAQQLDFLKNDSEKLVKKLDKKRMYLIYCAGGGRSLECAELMINLGFKEVVNLEKGFDDWKIKGFDVEYK